MECVKAAEYDRATSIEKLITQILDPKFASLLIKGEKIRGSSFLESIIIEVGQTYGLYGDDAATNTIKAKRIEELEDKAHELYIEANTFYPQYKGQFATQEEYDADRTWHYAEINERLAECKQELEELNYAEAKKAIDEPAQVSLVFNSEGDNHLKTLQQLGFIYLFTDWDGRGRESGYHFGLDVDWSVVPKMERDNPWDSIYRRGRANYDRKFLGDPVIGAQPFKPRQVIRNGVKVWTTEPPRGKKAPEEDPCLRLVVPIEIQKMVWRIIMDSWKL